MLVIEPLDGRRHDRSAFKCGEGTLDDYLLQRASQHRRDGIATTHVLVDSAIPSRILAYFTLSAAQLHLSELHDDDRKRLPKHPVPAVRMGRLAVALAEQGKGLGALLLATAVDRCLAMRNQLGVKVLVVDAINASAADFYLAYGFRRTAGNATTLYLALGQA